MRKRTHEEFVKIAREKGQDEYLVLGRYKDAKTKVKMKHLKCGFEWETSPDGFIGKSSARCPQCGYANMRTKQRKTDEYFKNEVFDSVGNKYSFIDRYFNNTTKLRIIHNECGHKYEVNPRDFLSGRRCPNCKGKRISESATFKPEVFEKRFYDLVGVEYTLLEPYKKAIEKVKVRHNTCGREYKVSPIKFVNGNRCPACVFKELGKSRRMSQDEFLERVEDISLGEIEVLGTYQGTQRKVKLKHKTCGIEWETVPDTIFRGGGCPHCKASLGEKEIERFLIDQEISYETQFRLKECRNIFPLPFDFAITSSKKVIGLIEFQGEQHYRSVPYFGGVDGYKKRVKNDNIKLEYCKENGIPLISIPYDEDIDKYKTIILKMYANLEPSALETV